MAAYGVDGCPAGWFYVCLESSEGGYLTMRARPTSDRTFLPLPLQSASVERGSAQL